MVLPEPDSPTTPTVSASRTLTDTPSTALTNPIVLRGKPALDGKPYADIPRLEDGLGGKVHRWRGAFRFSRNQRLCVGMARRSEKVRHLVGFDYFAFPHHRDIVGDLAHDAEVVGNEEHRHMMARLQLLQKLQDLGLHRNIEGGRRFIGDKKTGPIGERHGDHHPLALAAGELMREGAEPLAGIGNTDFLQKLDDA